MTYNVRYICDDFKFDNIVILSTVCTLDDYAFSFPRNKMTRENSLIKARFHYKRGMEYSSFVSLDFFASLRF